VARRGGDTQDYALIRRVERFGYTKMLRIMVGGLSGRIHCLYGVGGYDWGATQANTIDGRQFLVPGTNQSLKHRVGHGRERRLTASSGTTSIGHQDWIFNKLPDSIGIHISMSVALVVFRCLLNYSQIYPTAPVSNMFLVAPSVCSLIIIVHVQTNEHPFTSFQASTLSPARQYIKFLTSHDNTNLFARQ
jgi:hypothetical protein